jgi:metal-sulfur cluster biosynthetic enzyme
MPTKDEVIEALHAVEDPELGMDIVELGLLYDVEVDGPKVKVIHSLTSMGCPAGPMIQEDIHNVAAAASWIPSWIIGPAGQPIDVRLWTTFTFPPSTWTS